MSRQLGATEVKRLNRSWRRATTARICLLLESVSQPFNVGSIIRTAAAFGVDRIWLCGDTADPDHPAARKTALGTARYMEFERMPGAVAAAAVRAAGLRLVAVELADGATALHEAAIDGDICLAVGNEDRGCSAALLAAADLVAYIPQVGRVGSLNVASAVSVALAEARRREWAAPADRPGGTWPGRAGAGPDADRALSDRALSDRDPIGRADADQTGRTDVEC